MRFDRLSIFLELVRWMGRGVRGHGASLRNLLDVCAMCRELGVPEEHVGAGLVVVRETALRLGFEPSGILAPFLGTTAILERNRKANEALLATVRTRLAERGAGGIEAVLAGDITAAAVIYGSLEAYPARNVVVGAEPFEADGALAGTFSRAGGPVVRYAGPGGIVRHLEAYSRREDRWSGPWRLPDGELLVVLLAAQLGDPESNPESPALVHLAVALKGWRDRFDLPGMVTIAQDLGLWERVREGLCLVNGVFPELARVVPWDVLEVPVLERRLTVPLAARKILTTLLGDD